ncbi:MAG: hypothetical protein MSC30_18130 [Gaiellaceae bacterium MAG52_C11]|nr:hypothetical protein [Candidatus Gaiellasilicea maunaloa]
MSSELEPESTDGIAAHLHAVTEALEEIVRDRSVLRALSLDERTRLLAAAGDVHNPDVVARRRLNKVVRREKKASRTQADETTLAETGIRVLRAKPVFMTPNAFPPEGVEQEDVDEPEFRELLEPQHCYVCKRDYSELHAFYDQLCPVCGDFNYAKRTETADLSGRVALLTGGRVKIGYQAGIKLLRAGVHLIVTTRFPCDAAGRYAQEPDFGDWAERLEIFGLDLRHTPSVEGFCRHLSATRERLDFIVNNACQTVRRPPAFYRHMLEAETASELLLVPAARSLLGEYEGLRRSEILPAAQASAATPRSRSSASRARPSSRSYCSSRRISPARRTSFPKGASTRISSRSTCASGTRGACCWPRSRRSSCSRRNSSTRSPPSF